MDDAGVMDAPEVETPEIETEPVETGAEVAAEPQETETETEPGKQSDNPFSTKFSRDYRAWLNAQKSTDPNVARFVKQARDDYGRLYALQQLEPKGLDGIREKYALLDSLAHGEAKGADALSAMQDALKEWDEFDRAILDGDPKAFEGISPEFDAGLAKLAPAYLDRLAQSNPEALEAAVLPYIVNTLANSPALGQFNAMVDVLKEAPPTWLTPEQKSQWAADRMQRVVAHVAKMSEWFNSIGEKATANPAKEVDPKVAEIEERRTRLEQAEQKHHWDNKIEPLVSGHHQKLFEQYFKPYQTRLKLNDKGTGAMASAFRQGIIEAAWKDPDYQRQYKAFKGQKNPDPTTVSNYVNAWMSRQAKGILDGIVQERYGNFLSGKPRPQQAAKPNGVTRGPSSPNIEMRTVRPPDNEIDHKRRTLDQIAKKIFPLKNGKVVQLVQA